MSRKIYDESQAENIMEVLIEYIKQGYSIDELAKKIGMEKNYLYSLQNKYIKKHGGFSEEELTEINRLKKEKREDDHFFKEWEIIIQKRKENSGSEEKLFFLKGNDKKLEDKFEEVKKRWQKESMMGEEIKKKIMQKQQERENESRLNNIKSSSKKDNTMIDYMKINKNNIETYMDELENESFIQSQEDEEERKKLKEEKEFRKMIAEDLSDVVKKIVTKSGDLTDEEKEFRKMINEEYADLKEKKLKEMQDRIEKEERLKIQEKKALERRRIQKLVEEFKKTNIENEELKRKKEEIGRIQKEEDRKRKEKDAEEKHIEKIKKEQKDISELKEYVENGYSLTKSAEKMFCSLTRVRALVQKAKEKNEWYSDKEIEDFKYKNKLKKLEEKKNKKYGKENSSLSKNKEIEKEKLEVEVKVKKDEEIKDFEESKVISKEVNLEELKKECEIEYKNFRRKAILEDKKEIDGKKNVSLEGRKEFSKVLIKMYKLDLKVSEEDIELVLNAIYLHSDFADKEILKFLILDANKKGGLKAAKERVSELCELLKKSSKYFNQILEYKEEVKKIELEIKIKKLKAEHKTLNEISQILKISPIDIVNISSRKKSDLFEDLEK